MAAVPGRRPRPEECAHGGGGLQPHHQRRSGGGAWLPHHRWWPHTGRRERALSRGSCFATGVRGNTSVDAAPRPRARAAGRKGRPAGEGTVGREATRGRPPDAEATLSVTTPTVAVWRRRAPAAAEYARPPHGKGGGAQGGGVSARGLFDSRRCGDNGTSPRLGFTVKAVGWGDGRAERACTVYCTVSCDRARSYGRTWACLTKLHTNYSLRISTLGVWAPGTRRPAETPTISRWRWTVAAVQRHVRIVLSFPCYPGAADKCPCTTAIGESSAGWG